METAPADKTGNTFPKDDSEKTKQTYRIINFFKCEPGIALTCISAIVVVITFLTNTAIYVRGSAYLSYWNIDTIHVAISSTNQFYKICGNLIYAISVTISIWIINGTYEAYLPSKRLIISLNTLIGSCKQKVKQTNRKTQKTMNAIRKSRRNNPNLRIKGEAQNMHRIEKLSKYSFENIIDIQQSARKTKWTLRKKMFVHMFFAILVLSTGLILFNLFSSGTLLSFWAYLIFITIIFGTLLLTCIISLGKQVDRKAIRKNTAASLDKHIKELSDNPHKYPLTQNLFNKLSDNTIASCLFSAGIYIILLLILSSVLGHTDAQFKHDFPILRQDNKTYAVIYTTGENAILEECKIDNQNIVIHTYSQKIVSVNGLSYDILEFIDVCKVDKCTGSEQ